MSSRIVLVEDNPADVLLIKEALKHHGVAFSVEQYTNGEDAVKAVSDLLRAAEPLLPALFLVDLNIPRVHGFELLRVIRGERVLDEVPVAVLTSSQAPADKTESERLGADAYIVKTPGYYDFLTNVGGTIAQLLRRNQPGAGCQTRTAPRDGAARHASQLPRNLKRSRRR